MFENATHDWRAAHRHAGSRARAFFSKGLWFVLAQRLIRWLERVPLVGRPVRRITYFLVTILFKADFNPEAKVGKGLVILAPLGIVIGGKAVIGANVTIGPRVTVGQKSDRDPAMARIGNDVLIGKGAAIIGGITIGDGARIAPHSVVIRSVPPGAEVSGNPATTVISS